jgi:hypothetical protein
MFADRLVSGQEVGCSNPIGPTRYVPFSYRLTSQLSGVPQHVELVQLVRQLV